MKRIIVLLICILHAHLYCSEAVTGSVIREDLISPDSITRFRLPFVQDAGSYVNGGLTFNYPFTFTNSPRLAITVQLLGAFNSAITYVANVEFNSASSSTIRVNKLVYNGVDTVISEAASNEVFVTIYATDYPF